MATRLNFNVADNLAADSPDVDLNGTLYTFKLRWNARSGDWKLTCIDQDTSSVILANVRVSAGANLRIPVGYLFFTGKDPYDRADLNTSTFITFVSTEEYEDSFRLRAGDPIAVVS